jgi:hypothetical protein
MFVLMSTSAIARGLSPYGDAGHGRAFWLNDQAWRDPKAHPEKPPRPKFPKTYLDGVASRFGPSDGRADLFEHRLGGAWSPALVGAVDNGAAMIRLRWRSPE